MNNLICLHGNSLNSEIFTPLLMTGLKKNFDFHLIDLVKIGNNSGYTLNVLIDSLAKKLNSIENPKYILAHSLGGHLVLQSLAKLNDIHHIVLVGTPPLRSLADYPEAITKVPGQLMQKEFWSNYEVDTIAKATCSKNKTPIKKMLLKTPTKFRKKLFESLNSYNYINEIETIKNGKIPVSMFFSKKDTFINNDYVKDLAGHFKSCNNVQMIIENYEGHVPFYTNPFLFSSSLSNLSSK